MRKGAIITSLAALTAPAAVYAQESPDQENDGDFDLSATLAVTSDYRFRGLTLSDSDPAFQASLEVEHESGFYAGAWASTLGSNQADAEVDLYGGWRGKAGAIELDVGAVAYVYPGAADLDYVEILASASYSIGPAELKLGMAYAPDQTNLGSQDSFYAYGEASIGIPNTPVTLTAHVGREKGSLAGPTGKKIDWSLGAEVVVDKFTLGLKYTDTNVHRLVDPGRIARPGVMVSLTLEF